MKSKQATINPFFHNDQLFEITNDFRNESMIISVYLDADSTVEQCLAFIEKELDRIAMEGTILEPNLLEQLFRLIEKRKQDSKQDDKASLAIFMGADSRDALIKVISIKQSMANQFDVYARPNLLPLIHAADPLDSAVLLVYWHGSVRIYDIEHGDLKPVGWANAPHIFAHDGSEQVTVNNGQRISSRLKRACMSLLKRRYKPMILAARYDQLSALKQWLPSQLSWTVQHDVEIPAPMGWSGIIDWVKKSVRLQMRMDADQWVERLILRMKMKGKAVVGTVATLHALKDNTLERLLIEKNHYIDGSQCCHCSTGLPQQNLSCSHCGSKHIRPWKPVIDAACMALRRGIPVVSVESDTLRYLGGMGGLIGHTGEVARQPLPAVLPPVSIKAAA